ncbi:protein SRG1-like [Aristolochia californica]|uniref:protein SRG1-like n=1 Tax=Aristolochia californica TaxID=171875 RepID=UPI0035D6597F
MPSLSDLGVVTGKERLCFLSSTSPSSSSPPRISSSMESIKPLTLGSSLLVPNVQELAKQPMETIPPRYLRPELNSRIINSTDSSQIEIPVIDLRKFHIGESIFASELEKFHMVCRDWSFFQLVNHGVKSSVVEKMKLAIQQFFALTMEEKKRYWQQPGEVEGFGQAFVVSEEQKLDWNDIFYTNTLPPELRKSHLYDNLPLYFREAMEAYSLELEKLAKELLGLMAKALGMDEKDMAETFEGGAQSMRMNYYPPCPQPEEVIGLTPHSDATGLTLLLQVNEMEGLQIRKDGVWVPVKPLPDAFIVNIGDCLEILTNGIYRSIEHRAVVNSTKERLSIATFYNPRMLGEIGPAHSLVTAERPAKFKTVATEKYFKDFFTRELNGKSFLDSLRIEGTTAALSDQP